MENELISQQALADCESEPIQIPGSIQSHGVLLTLRSSDFTILQVSESSNEILGIHHTELIHQPLSKVMPIASVERATKRLGDRVPRLLNPIPIEIMVRGKSVRLDGILHRAGRVLILELERHIDEDRGYGGFGGFYEAIREVASKMMVTENLSEVLELGCQEIQKLTEFDRVLIYKFDEEWNGEVIHESKINRIESLLHHHFPASDIPKQARELYTTNWLRLIPNVNYKPSPMFPVINPITDKPLDMSNAVLRSVSPVHLEYMRNMGQTASMSISLLNGRKLWGLISCHHSAPHQLKYDVRVASEFIGQMVSAQIVAREESTELDHKLQLKKLYDDLLKLGGDYSSIADSFAMNSASLLSLTDSQGSAIYIDGRWVLVGAAPNEKEVETIRQWVVAQATPIVLTDELPKRMTNFENLNPMAYGVLGLTGFGNEQDCVLWFRPEVRSQTKWAGDPASAKQILDSGKIHPRTSFQTWFQNAEGKSRKWRQPEIDSADELRRLIVALASKRGPWKPPTSDLTAFRNSLANSLATSAHKTAEEPSLVLSAQIGQTMASDAGIAERVAAMMESYSDSGIVMLSRDGAIQTWSTGAKQLLGYNSGQILGRGFQLIFAEGEILREKQKSVLEEADQQSRFQEEMWLYRSDSTSFWGKMIVSSFRDHSGSLIGYSMTIQDITKDRALEEEMKATRLAAEAANAAKTAFLANISHEIRTPLGAVLGFSELMAGADVDADDRAMMYSRVKTNGEQLLVLIDDLLDLGKAEAGKIEVELLPIDLNAFLVDIESTFKMKASARDILMTVRRKDPLPTIIRTDPTRLRQILTNILSNSIKFTAKGGSVDLAISSERMAGDENVVFRVTDTGTGMSESEMSKLFQPFVQADVSTTRKFGGTGLGLFLSQKLARSLGGDLTIESSRVGVGSTFLAYVPAQLALDGTRSSPPKDNGSAQTLIRSGKALAGLRILVTDDSKDNRDLISLYLRREGAEVDFAENGKIALEKALGGNYHAVLMDIQMPVMDGDQAMRSLMEAHYPKPVIALTAHAMREEREQSLRLGFSEYLTKPLDRTQLIAALQKFVKCD